MPQQSVNPIINLLPLVVIFIIFYFLLIRPQKTKQMEHQKMLSNLKKNDEVITSSGIYATVVNVKDATVILRIDENVKIEILKDFISSVRKSANS
ncbi:MAG: preprotein translocase subunit YajC [Candidatus Omnitrophota bacterium]|nr:preprotein translocase subunit YajC [Candidatus Omnitrophota bacterium]